MRLDTDRNNEKKSTRAGNGIVEIEKVEIMENEQSDNEGNEQTVSKIPRWKRGLFYDVIL